MRPMTLRLAQTALVAGLAAIPTVAAAVETPYDFDRPTFQNVVFGETRPELINKLAKYKLTKQDGNLLRFTGPVAGETAEVMGVFTPKTGRLWKVVVYFSPPGTSSFDTLKSRYEKFKKALTDKYGPPESQYAYFSSPYTDGDGYEIQALKLEKAHFTSFWGKGNGGITCKLTKWLDVSISYENAEFSALDDAEKAGQAQSDL